MLPFREIIWTLTLCLFANGFTPEQFLKETIKTAESLNDSYSTGWNFLNCKAKVIRIENFQMDKFLGEWHELAKSYNGYMDLHSAIWKFIEDVDDRYKFYYSAVAGDNNCIRPLKGKLDVFDGELLLSYNTFSSTVKEKLHVIYTDYENIAALYSCLYTIPETEICHPAAIYGAIISRKKILDSKILQRALIALKDFCIDPRTLQHPHSEVNCWFDGDFRTDEDDIPGPDFCYQSPETGYCRGSFQRYYFDWKSDKCTTFSYSGCGGNDNNFLTLHECQKKCQETRKETQCYEFAECALNCPPCCREINGCVKCDCDQIAIDPPAFTRKENNCIQSPAECTSDCPVRLISKGCYSCSCILDIGRAPGSVQQNNHEYPILSSGDCPGRCRLIYRENEILCSCTNQDICILPKNRGSCDGNELKYYFNSNSGKCETFSYSGCKGNLNNFISLEKCTEFCGDICDFPRKEGDCKMALKRFYFDSDSLICNSFPYSSCNGNENNFVYEKDCKSRCGDVCQESVDPGHCSENIKRYYFDKELKKCQEFNFTGCMGNKNNFYTLSECQRKCEGISPGFVIRNKSICRLPPDKGPCRKYTTRFYYDSVNQTCMQFEYGGCEGNENNFQSKEDCSVKCYGTVIQPIFSLFAVTIVGILFQNYLYS